MMIGTAGSVMSESDRKLVRGMWAIREAGLSGQQSASRPPCVRSVGRDTAYQDPEAIDQSIEPVPA